MSQGYTKGTPIDTDPTLSANSNLVTPSQAAVVVYVNNQIALYGGLNTNYNVLIDGGSFLIPNNNTLIDGGNFI